MKHTLMINTQHIVTEESIRNADNVERCILMREIVRGAEYCPKIKAKEHIATWTK